jgi:hypothetical protein
MALCLQRPGSQCAVAASGHSSPASLPHDGPGHLAALLSAAPPPPLDLAVGAKTATRGAVYGAAPQGNQTRPAVQGMARAGASASTSSPLSTNPPEAQPEIIHP